VPLNRCGDALDGQKSQARSNIRGRKRKDRISTDLAKASRSVGILGRFRHLSRASEFLEVSWSSIWARDRLQISVACHGPLVPDFESDKPEHSPDSPDSWGLFSF
jgi:hypothetical protein